MSTVGSRIRECRIAAGLSVEEMADRIGKNRATVYRYEKDEVDMPLPVVSQLADVLNVSPAYLMGWEEDSEKSIIEKIGLPMTRIPILGRISAGLPLFAEQNVEGYTLTTRNGGNEYFALRVVGDSMTAAGINPGNTIIVRRQTTVNDGEIAVVMVDNEDATIKRFHRSGATITLSPQSFNPKHLPQIYDLRKTRIEILGKVVDNIISFE